MGIFSRFPYTDFHRLNADWILEKVKEMLGLTQQAAADAAAAADDAAAAAASAEEAATGSVRYDRVQDLTALQQGQARDNIQAAPADMFGTVRYDEVQLLEDAQKTRARSNIGAAASGVADNCVRFDSAQSLSGTQQAQARSNIGAADTIDVANVIQDLQTLATYAVRVNATQTFSDAQKALARANIGSPAAADVPTTAVLYSSQSLTDEQKALARTNIGAAAEGSVPVPAGAVLYDQVQSLTATQKTQAQDNIGAAPTSAPVFTSSIEISSQATGTIAADQIMIYPSTLQADTVSKLTLAGDVSPASKGVILQNIETPVDTKDAANKAYVDNAILKQISVTGNTPSIDLASEIDGVAYETLITCTGSALTSITISTAANSPMLATIVFTTGSTAPTFDSPLSIIGLDDLIPAASTIYEISIRGHRAVWHSWEVGT